MVHDIDGINTPASGLTSSKQYSDLGDAVTLTCAYTENTSAATITWYKNNDVTSDNVSSGGAGKSLVTLASTAFSDSAEYKCKVDYGGSFGSHTSDSLKQYVRGIATGVTGTKYALIGSAVTQTCTVHGDILSKDVVWTNSKGAIVGASYTKTTAAYSTSDYSTTSTLTISAVTAADTTSFTCTVEYTQGSASKTGMVPTEILSEFNKCCCKSSVYTM